MNLANTSKRVLPWFAIISFFISGICMIVDLLQAEYLIPWIDTFGWFNYLQIFGIPIPQLFPVITDSVSVIVFFFFVFIAAALLGITKKHCYLPAVLGLFILVFVAIMLIQEFLFSADYSKFNKCSVYLCYPEPYMFMANICRILYCLPVCILALYMIVASFFKITGKKFVLITVAVIVLVLIATLLLSIPLDYMQSLSGRGRNMIFGIYSDYEGNYNIFDIFTSFRIEYLKKPGLYSSNFWGNALLTWISVLFQYVGFLLYLPAALYRPKAQKTNE